MPCLFAVLFASQGCGLADNAGALDVLSGARDASLADASGNPLTCGIRGALCTICIGTNRCLVEYGACTADATCRPALEAVVDCVCKAQSVPSGDVPACDVPFRASSSLAVALADCMAHGCIDECGLHALVKDGSDAN
jgi:hypothetical protein